MLGQGNLIRKFVVGDSSYVPAGGLARFPDGDAVGGRGGMSEQDLGAIYDYLHALDPVVNKVEYWSPAHEKRTAEVR